MSTFVFSLLPLLAFIALTSCALSGLNPDQVNSVLLDTKTLEKETPKISSAEKSNVSKEKQEKITEKGASEVVAFPAIVDGQKVVTHDGEDVEEEDEDSRDIIQEDDIQDGDEDKEEATDDDEKEDDEEVGQQEEEDDDEDESSKQESKPASKEAKVDPKVHSKEARVERKIEPTQAEDSKIMEQSNVMVDIIHLLDGKNACTVSPTGELNLNVEWLKKEGGEAGQKLIDLVEDDRKAMVPGSEIRSDAIFLKEGVLSFKLGLKDDKDKLKKMWEEGGKKDVKMEQTIKNIKSAMEKVEGLVKIFNDAISKEHGTSPKGSALEYKNEKGTENGNAVTAPTA